MNHAKEERTEIRFNWNWRQLLEKKKQPENIHDKILSVRHDKAIKETINCLLQWSCSENLKREEKLQQTTDTLYLPPPSLSTIQCIRFFLIYILEFKNIRSWIQ